MPANEVLVSFDKTDNLIKIEGINGGVIVIDEPTARELAQNLGDVLTQNFASVEVPVYRGLK